MKEKPKIGHKKSEKGFKLIFSIYEFKNDISKKKCGNLPWNKTLGSIIPPPYKKVLTAFAPLSIVGDLDLGGAQRCQGSDFKGNCQKYI